MITSISTIKDNIIASTPLTLGVIYCTNAEFEAKGINDRVFNQFYIRNTKYDTKKYKFDKGDLLDLVKTNYRLVVQIKSKDCTDNYFKKILGLLFDNDCVKLTYASDDTEAIYLEETKKEFQGKGLQLFSYDFELTDERDFSKLECLEIC